MRSKFFSVSLSLFLVITLSITFTHCTEKKSNDHEEYAKHWSYEGNTGPNYWGNLNPDYWLASHGKNQSPINIETESVIKSDLPNIQFNYETSMLTIINNGHAIEVVPEQGGYIMIDEIKYDLLQYHFHSLSEHTIDGNYFPVEGHFVHRNAAGDLAVIGLMIENGEENKIFKPIWDKLPNKGSDTFELQTKINADDLLPIDRRSYQYSGSLTTPPCSEGVKWFILATPVEMSPEQIDAFKIIYKNNYRPVQALNARRVLLDTTN